MRRTATLIFGAAALLLAGIFGYRAIREKAWDARAAELSALLDAEIEAFEARTWPRLPAFGEPVEGEAWSYYRRAGEQIERAHAGLDEDEARADWDALDRIGRAGAQISAAAKEPGNLVFAEYAGVLGLSLQLAATPLEVSGVRDVSPADALALLRLNAALLRHREREGRDPEAVEAIRPPDVPARPPGSAWVLRRVEATGLTWIDVREKGVK